ncbi:DNA cytosine methyltransferase [Romboutsia ilealis]|uniref:Cytosine-specific methyltransferase n=2 Tax=Romboutsia faecis TaxID=2764597 RepID=A0ABR7JK22_9FIRM|nr:DNA cytosine methyltransferase [Romboutsia faecis]MRN24476.1 DNA cytosine methyltransferase [Romboutsia ilealis]
MSIATVFSGIGAIEWALKRMNIDHNIVFACDNGDIEVEIEDEEGLREEIKKFETADEQNEYIRKIYESRRKTNFVKQTYLENYELEDKDFLYDVRFIDGTKYKGQVDLFVGGSPCQSFSIMGHQRGLEDTRGTLFYDFARLVKEIEPKVFIYENVQGMLKHDGGNTWNVIHDTFLSLGYKIYYKLLDAKDYGIPQTRRRVFVVGFKDKIDGFDFPKEQELEFTMQDFLETNVKFGGYNSINGNIVLHEEHGEIDSKHFLSEKVLSHVMSPGTKGYYTKPEIDLKIARPLLSTMHKMHRAGVDNYVTLDGRVRRLTPRECLRLMGYDDDFKQVVSDTQMYKQAGNSIVVDVLINLMESIINSYPKIIGESYVVRDIKTKECIKEDEETYEQVTFDYIAVDIE